MNRQERARGTILQYGSEQTRVRGGGANERGIALVVALVMLLLVGMLGAFALSNSSTDLKITGNFRNLQQAFYQAEAGVEYAQNAPEIYTNAATMIIPVTRETYPASGIAAPFPSLSAVGAGPNVLVTYITCGALPTGSGTETDSSIGGTDANVPTRAFYYMIQSRGEGSTGSEIYLESQTYRPVFACP